MGSYSSVARLYTATDDAGNYSLVLVGFNTSKRFNKLADVINYSRTNGIRIQADNNELKKIASIARVEEAVKIQLSK